MGAVYPTSLVSFTEKEDKIDIVYADHVNKLQEEVVALQTEVGVNPAGSLADLVSRLAVLQDTDGSLAKGTSFPGSPIDGQGYYRTDLNVFYIYNGSTWDAQGQSLSNVLFTFALSHGPQFHVDTDIAPANPTANYASWFGKGSVYSTAIRSKLKMFAGLSTVTWYSLVQSSFGDGKLAVEVGGASSEVTTVTNSLVWRTNTIDVSGLTAGTIYDINITIVGSASEAGESTHLYSLIGIAS